ncbi:MAG: 1-phosphofructokinase family hexose kinase [Anaerolineae bacterium]|jgi:6-phosphofructokinase 2
MDNPSLPPIATLTLNPCLDVSYEFLSLMADQKVSVDHTRFDPGGNGINVGRALKRLGLVATNCCLLAGEIGNLVERLLERQLDNLQVTRIAGETRINCTILEKKPRVQYELDGIGPYVDAEALEQVETNLLNGAQCGLAVLTGSIPAGVPDQVYGDLVERLRQHGARAIVDTKGPMLRHALTHDPFLIKPNRYELETLCGRKLPTLEAVAKEARRLQEGGVTYVCVSLGGEGAVLVGPERAYHATVPQVQVRSTVGAGDALLGGLVAAFAQDEDPADALRLGVCCGSGTAEKPGTGLFARQALEDLMKRVEIRPLDI